MPADWLQVEARFDSEESRTHHYLSSQTSLPIRRILERHLLSPHLSSILHNLHSGLDFMIDGDRIDDLSRLYRLFTMVSEGIPTLRKALRESIIRRGSEINAASASIDVPPPAANEDEERSSKVKGKGKARPPMTSAMQTLQLALKWVQDVLDLKDKFDLLWTRSFKENLDIEATLNEV